MDDATFFEELEESAKEELKRAEHLIVVSLKYTRTCAVMSNAIKRLISAFEMAFIEYLFWSKEKKKISEVPATKKARAILVKSLLGQPYYKYMILYNKLVRYDKTAYCTISEYRKHLTMKLKDKKGTEIKVCDLENYLKDIQEFNKEILEICV